MHDNVGAEEAAVKPEISKKRKEGPVQYGLGVGMRKTKLETARFLAAAHKNVEPNVKQVFLLTSERDDDPREPIRLLEVMDNVIGDDIFPITFAPDPANGIEYPSSIIEISRRAFAALRDNTIEFRGNLWKVDQELVPAYAGD